MPLRATLDPAVLGNRQKISLVIPVCNESDVLTARLNKLTAELTGAGIDRYELIIVENGSQDGTWKTLRSWAKHRSRTKVIRLKTASYGLALRRGLVSASGKWIYCFNIDFFSVPFIESSFLLANQADIVVGSKLLPDSRDLRNWQRKSLTRFWNWLLQRLFHYPGTDTHGIKCFRNTQIFQEMIPVCRAHYDLFDTELVMRLVKSGSRLVELPVMVTEVRPTRYLLGERLINFMADCVLLITKRSV